jgi:hypothetical protein
MKYLKRFNEELNPGTYRSAAYKLKKKGHMGRAKELEDWSHKREKDESIIKWKKAIQEMSEFGTYKLNVKNPDSGESFTGDFHLELIMDRDAFGDQLDDMKSDGSGEFFLTAGIIPTSQEVLDRCEEIMPEPEFGNGFYWGFCIIMNFELGNSLEFKSFEIGHYDSSMSGEVSIVDRGSAGRLKNLLKKMFTDPSLNYPSGYRDVNNFYDLVQNKFCIEYGLSSDYGFDVEQVSDFINTLSVNDMYKSL